MARLVDNHLHNLFLGSQDSLKHSAIMIQGTPEQPIGSRANLELNIIAREHQNQSTSAVDILPVAMGIDQQGYCIQSR